MRYSSPTMLVIGLLSVVILAGCRTSHFSLDRVDTRMLLPPGAERHTVDDGEVFLMAAPVDETLPVFQPVGHASNIPPVTVCVEFIVNIAGEVESVAPVVDGDGCQAPISALALEFSDAVMSAVRNWSYVSAALCRPAHPADVDCQDAASVLQPVPIKLAFAFTYRRSAGKDSLGAGRITR